MLLSLISYADSAVMVLDCCIDPTPTIPKDNKEYSIEFDYSLLEDYQDRKAFLEDGGFTPTCGSVGFDRKNHPLNLMVSVVISICSCSSDWISLNSKLEH